MSLELMVFVPDSAPTDPDDFFDWFDEQTEWDEDHSYRDAKVAAPPLQAWFKAVSAKFPVLGVKRQTEYDTEYSIGREMIHAVFPRGSDEAVRELVFDQASIHRLGVFEASSEDGAIWWPDARGTFHRR